MVVKRFHIEWLSDQPHLEIRGRGKIALGAQFPDGRCVVWIEANRSFRFYDSVEAMRQEHEHCGAAKVVFER